MLTRAQLLGLTSLGLLPKHAIDWRLRDGQFQYRHATKGWRGRSLKSLATLGVL